MKAALEGDWSGTAAVSPFGPFPYRIVFRKSAAVIVGETPPPVGGQTALGGYQRLVFRRAADGTEVCEYKASVTKGFSEGVLTLEEDAASRITYCATDGGCSAMMLVFEKDDEGRLHFETHIRGELHADMALTRK
jgi:hypothetical protein